MKSLSTPVIFVGTLVVAAALLLLLITSTGTNVYDNFALPLEITEYYDYSCGHCQDIHPALVEIQERFGDDVVMDYQYFQIFPDSRQAEIAAQAAGLQGKYYEFHNAIFDEIIASGISPDSIDFQKIAADLELDLEQFNSDFEGEEVAAAVDATTQAARDRGITATPTVYIDGIAARIETDANGEFTPFVNKVADIIEAIK